MEDAVGTVRSFNRVVTQCVGALNEHYLARSQSLGAARVLWEIGQDGCAVRDLRVRLGLDSGYVSRLLRSLEGEGLVTVGVAGDDLRVRRVGLTKKGRAERRILDRRSDELAQAILERLTDAQRQRLVRAMAEVERILTAAMVAVEVVDPADAMARYCLRRYFAELDERFESGFNPAASLPADPAEMRLPAGLFLVAMVRGEPVGCGALKFHHGPAELKRMWVDPVVRGLGLGRRLLHDLETHAAQHGVDIIRLETNKTLVEAVAMYQSAGYREVDAFNDEAYAHHWFEKHLEPVARPRGL